MRFQLMAVNETNYWIELPEECERVYGIYLVCPDEVNHLCSLTPSYRADFICNKFDLPPEHPFYEDNWGIGEDTYFDKLTPALSEPFEADDWEEAMEYAQSNPPYVPTP